MISPSRSRNSAMLPSVRIGCCGSPGSIQIQSDLPFQMVCIVVVVELITAEARHRRIGPRTVLDRPFRTIC